MWEHAARYQICLGFRDRDYAGVVRKAAARIFRPAETDQFRRNAVVNFDPSLSRVPIAHGYALGARRLADGVLAEARNQDYLIRPICFLYRHAVELQLKHIVSHSLVLLQSDEKAKPTHKLADLWAGARRAILQISPASAAECETLDPIIGELVSIDPSSETFRYPTRNDGSPSWPGGHALIDIEGLAEVMDDAVARLDAACAMVESWLDAHTEWHAYEEDLRREYERDLRDLADRDR